MRKPGKIEKKAASRGRPAKSRAKSKSKTTSKSRRRPIKTKSAGTKKSPLFASRWFYHSIESLDRLESRFIKNGPDLTPFGVPEAMDVDGMPDYVVTSFRKQLLPFDAHLGIASVRSEGEFSSKTFGQILGAKLSVFASWAEAVRIWKRLGPAGRSKFTPEYHEAFQKLEYAVRMADPSLPNIAKRSFQHVASQPLLERAQFFEGFGVGLAFFPQLTAALRRSNRKKEGKKLKREIMALYIVQFWPFIEHARVEGGWPAIQDGFQEFVAALSENLEIDEESFRKALQRAGIKNVGKVGAPVKKRGKSKDK